MNKQKRFFILFLIILALAGIFFLKEFRRALGITTSQSNTPIISDGMANIPIDQTDPILGNPGADLNIILFGDFSCAKCREVYTQVAKTVRANSQKMRLVWKSAPLGGIFTAGNFLPHQAAYCAGQQKQFWPFAEMAMADKYNLTEAGLKKVAEGLKLNTTTWWQCTNSDLAKKKITDTVAIVDSLHLRSVPALFVNNKLVDTDAKINLEELLVSFIK